MEALRAAVFPLSAKNRRGGHILSPPPPVRVLNPLCYVQLNFQEKLYESFNLLSIAE